MSLCRWSSDNFRCDLYCYESYGGFITHVASSRIVGDLPMEPLYAIPRKEELGLTSEQVAEILRVHRKALNDAERRPIGLPHDGESFVDNTAADWKARITGLVRLGYHVPDGVLEEIDGYADVGKDETPTINASIRTAQENAAAELFGHDHASEIVRIAQELDLP